MNSEPFLIVMLTHDDKTVDNAEEIFEQCKNSDAIYWGMKEEPISLDRMKKLFSYMRSCGKKTVLEVVAYTEDKCMRGAEMAVECGCDILMGTLFFDSVNDYCKQKGIKYMPYVGKVYDRPSILDGSVEDMINEAREYTSKGAYGVNLLGYRYVNDPSELISKMVKEVNAPVCVAGSVDSYERLDELKEIAPWSFTIGSAFFEKVFDDDFCTAVNKVCAHMKKNLVSC